MVARLNHHPDVFARVVVHMDHLLTTSYRRSDDLLTAECSCGNWTVRQYTGWYHVPVDLHSAHAAHVEHALTRTPKEPTMSKPSIAAGNLSADQIGHTIRLTTVDGVTIEDRLTRVEHAVYGADKDASTRVAFANVQPSGSMSMSSVLLGQTSGFKVAADTIVAITAGPAA